MNKLENHLAISKKNNKKALILFITAGDPDLPTTLEVMRSMAENGVDCIELGIPFSDPIADGLIIQKSTQRALKNKIRVEYIFDLVRQFRPFHQTPIVLMGYYNPIMRYGSERFVQNFRNAGGDGLIIADLPYEEGEEFENISSRNEVSLIYLLAPEIGSQRTKKILNASSGFVYCVSHYGTTGMGSDTETEVDDVVDSLKSMTDLPIMVGFGISSMEKARAAVKIADGIIIGSWLIKELESAEDKAKAAGDFTSKLKQGVT